MTKHENIRFWLAVAVAPAFPLAVLSIIQGKGYWPLIFFFGYLFSLLVAMPIIAVVMVKRSFLSCLICGGIAASVPFVLFGALAMFGPDIFSLSVLRDLCGFFALGAGGGALFWVIAFLKPSKKPVL
jgi:hypothetical protein